MASSFRIFLIAAAMVVIASHGVAGQTGSAPIARFEFDGTAGSSVGTPVKAVESGPMSYGDGIDGEALTLGPGGFLTLPTDLGNLGSGADFSLRFWIRTEANVDRRFVVLSHKGLDDNSLASQKNAGWVFFVSDGTWAWNVGSGERRLTYERENGDRMPINDGRWHQLAMTYSADLSQIRLFYDGVNWVTYNVTDGNGFDFSSQEPLTIGWDGVAAESDRELLPLIVLGSEQLQTFIDAFNALGERPIASDEFLRVIVDPREVFEERAGRQIDDEAWAPVAAAEAALMDNPYTIHQALEFMEAARLSRIYTLIDGRVVIRRDVAARYAARERLSTPDFEIDELAIWDRVLSPNEVRDSYAEHFDPSDVPLTEELAAMTAAAWNIWHGGQHFTLEADGWDSRKRLAEMIADEAVDLVMMQETYSSGDFIAAELGYYFATTVDWDYLNQGANISVLSRYPITEVHVPEASPFSNVGVRVQVSATQDLYVMSNWYGMDRFPDVFDFHEGRFAGSDTIPVLFGGDFNAVPHTDGGESPASVTLTEAGFTDAFRSARPGVDDWPGATHTSGRRIDQLYFKGTGLRNTATRVISTWDSGFPSDHYMIRADFQLTYRTRER